MGGTAIYPESNRLSRLEALRLYTLGSAWFSGEEDVKGRIAPGQLADFAVLTADYLSVPEAEIQDIESCLTVLGGKVVYAAAPFQEWAPPAVTDFHPNAVPTRVGTVLSPVEDAPLPSWPSPSWPQQASRPAPRMPHVWVFPALTDFQSVAEPIRAGDLGLPRLPLPTRP